MRLHALERDARVARLPVDPVPETLDVRADASLRHLDVEWDDRAGAGEPRATDRLRHIGLRAETRGASSMARDSSTTSSSGRAYAFVTALPA